MAEPNPSALQPPLLLPDRYQGVCSGGAWIAIREPEKLFQGISRASWVAENGPSGGDLEAGQFWSKPPCWIASGKSPEEAIKKLGSDPS
jgi:hypothetical protein